MNATVKKDIEVALVMTGDEAKMLYDFFGELSYIRISKALENNDTLDKRAINELASNIYNTLNKVL